jgi:L-asparaginase II
MVGGSDRFDKALARRKGQAVYAKVGAEGVYAAAIPEMGLGIALKIDDGAKRAAEVALAAVLRYLEALDDEDWDSLRAFAAPTLRNHAGLEVGEIRPAADWPHGRAA